MKLGPLEIKMASRNGAKPSTTEIGSTGTDIFANRLSPIQDYNDALNPPQSYAIFDKMRLGDGTVSAALRVIKMPLLNADWSIEPASDSAQDREIASFIEADLNNMTTSRHATMRQILLHLDYGNAPFEKVWRMEAGQVHLQKLAFRHPRTITKWLTDANGGLAGIEQLTSPDFRVAEIPVNKLIVFVNDLEGSNFTGISILRPAYKHWYYVDGLERVQAIAIEKRSQGVDVVTLSGEAVTDQRKLDAERAAMTMHGHEKMYYVAVKEQNEYDVKGIEGDVLDPLPAIERHDLRVVRSMITEFLAMGAGSTGSLAMHRDKSSFSLMALGGVANNVVETVNAHLIKQWVDYNWTVKEYPRLKYTHLDARPLAEFAEAILKFSQAKALSPTIEVENAARAMLDLPPIPEGQWQAPVEPISTVAPQTMDDMPTGQAVEAVRALRAMLKERREPEGVQA